MTGPASISTYYSAITLCNNALCITFFVTYVVFNFLNAFLVYWVYAK